MSRRRAKGYRHNPRLWQIRTFRCEVCGNVSTAPKAVHLTGAGHTKHMYCWKCRETTEHKQIQEGCYG